MERNHPPLDLFDEPLSRLRQVAGEAGQTNAAGRDLNQFGQLRDVHQHYHFSIFSELLSRAGDISSQFPLAQDSFRPAFSELSALENILAQSQKAATRAPVQGEQEEQLEDAQQDVERTLIRLHEHLNAWRSWDNEYRQRWLQDEGKHNLKDIVDSLRKNADRFVEFQQEIQSIYDLVPEYMRNRAESSVTSDDKLDSLLTNHSEWEIAKNDMIRWGMSGNMLEEKKVEVVQLMQQCRDEGVDGARIREQAAEYENARIRLEEDSESLHSDEQDDYGEDLTTSNNNTSITAREVSRATREYQMLRLKALWGGGKTLIELTREGDIEAVEMLLGARVNPNNIDENERTCLHWTAQLGLVDIAALLIKYGASVDAQAKEGRTPLYMAAVNKHHGMVKLLLQNRADTRATGMNNNFPLHEAAYAGSVECINLLLDVDDSVINAQSTLGLTPLMLSTYATSPKAALCLLSRGAETEKVNNQGMTALAIAASRGNLSTVKVLLRKDPAQLERKDNKGYTPLIHAVMKQRVDVTTFLIGKKADVTAKASDNRSLLSWAALYGSTDLLDILLKEKQDVNAQDSRGFTPLHLAAYAGRWQNVRRLLDPKYRAVITAKTNDGWMPLHEACAKGTLKTVEILLNHGAPIMARDKWQWTPLHRAAQAGHLEIARYLIEQGADIEAKTPYDWTPLHEAIYGGFTSLVSLFLDNDADTAAYDDQGLDALQKAREYKKQDVAELIKRHEAKLGSINATSTTVDDDLDTYDQGPETTTSLDAAKPDKKASKNGAASLRIFPMQMIRYMVGKRLDISIGLVALATGLAVLRPILRSSR